MTVFVPSITGESERSQIEIAYQSLQSRLKPGFNFFIHYSLFNLSLLNEIGISHKKLISNLEQFSGCILITN